MEASNLSRLIKRIASHAKTQRDDIHMALIGCTYHCVAYRNTQPFNQLFDAVGAGVRKEGMLKWASLNAPVYFNDGRVVLSDQRQKEIANTIGVEVHMANLVPLPKWYEITKPEPVANPWDSHKFIEGLAEYLAGAKKKADKNGADGAVLDSIYAAEMVLRRITNTKFDADEMAARLAA